MGIPVMILGESGTGKSASMRNFTPDEIGVINVCGKPLPFRSQIKLFNSDNYMHIEKALKSSSKKTMVTTSLYTHTDGLSAPKPSWGTSH